jgi:hypothetical protein
MPVLIGQRIQKKKPLASSPSLASGSRRQAEDSAMLVLSRK